LIDVRNAKNDGLIFAGPRFSLTEPAKRPTGHSSSVIPIPYLGVPVRLEIRREPLLALSPPLLLVEQSFVDQIAVLEEVFPGIEIRELCVTNLPTGAGLRKLVSTATLVVDPDSNIRPRLDILCAQHGVNFVGDSVIWPQAASMPLLRQVRKLLTDYAFALARLAQAHQRASAMNFLKRADVFEMDQGFEKSGDDDE
jgi:hypothetical protein